MIFSSDIIEDFCRLSERQDELPCCKEQERNRQVFELLKCLAAYASNDSSTVLTVFCSAGWQPEP